MLSLTLANATSLPPINSDSTNRATRSSTQASTAKSTHQAAERDKKRLPKNSVEDGSGTEKSSEKKPKPKPKPKPDPKQTSKVGKNVSIPRVTSNGKAMPRTTAEKNREEEQVADDEARAAARRKENGEDPPVARNARTKLSNLGITTDAPAQPLSKLQQSRHVRFSPSDSNSDFQLSTPHKPSGQPTPTWAKEAAGYTASSPALETEEADLGEGRGDTSGEVDFRPEVMAPEIMVSLRKPGNDQDADGPSRSILVKKCAIYMDEVAPYCKISEVLPKLGQEYTPAKNRTTKFFSRSQGGRTVQIGRGDALAVDVPSGISTLPPAIDHVPVAWDESNKIWELTILSEETPGEKAPTITTTKKRKPQHTPSTSPDPEKASQHVKKHARTSAVRTGKQKMRVFSPPDDDAEEDEGTGDRDLGRGGNRRKGFLSDAEESSVGDTYMKEEAMDDFNGSSMTEGRSEEHAIMISSSPDRPPKLSALEKADAERKAVRWLRQHWKVSRFDDTAAGTILGKTLPVREDLRRYSIITDLQKKSANANQKVPGSAPKEIRGVFITVDMLKQIVGAKGTTWNTTIKRFRRTAGGGLEDAVEAQEWVDNPDGPLSEDYSQISLAEFDRRCSGQRAAERVIKQSRNRGPAPPTGNLGQQPNPYWNYPYPGQPGPSNWQPPYNLAPTRMSHRKGSVDSNTLDG